MFLQIILSTRERGHRARAKEEGCLKPSKNAAARRAARAVADGDSASGGDRRHGSLADPG